MSEPKFTPGPWKISEYRNGHSMIIEGSDEWDVAEVGYPNRDPNANLIKSAPDLYEALEGLLADITEYQEINNLGGQNNHWQVKAKAALAKARGEV